MLKPVKMTPMANSSLFKRKAFCLALLLWLCVLTPQALAGRYVLNQTPSTIQGYFGQPVNEVINYYSTKDLQRIFPDFPKQGTFKIIFANNKAQRIELDTTQVDGQGNFSYDHAKFFEYIFGYKPPIKKVIKESGGEGFKAYEICLGDGVATSYTIAPGGLFITLYYKTACEPPYK